MPDYYFTIFLAFLAVVWTLIGPVIAIIKASWATTNAREARKELANLHGRMLLLERALRHAPTPDRPALPPMPKHSEQAPAAEMTPDAHNPVPETTAAMDLAPPSMPTQTASAPAASAPPAGPWWPTTPSDNDNAMPAFKRTSDIEPLQPPTPPKAPTPPKPPGEAFSLERFMGVKLFAWLGGVALFFGIIYFVIYAFENFLVSPGLRVAMGFVNGAGLLVAGVAIQRIARYQVLAQSFCATGILILYGVTFAAHAFYRFPGFGPLPTFALMALITLTAFLLALRFNALVVALLGMLGGFLTPWLVNTGRDNILGLAGYIIMLDIGLLALARHGRWRFLASAAAAGTVIMQIGWYARFFEAGHYVDFPRIWLPMGIMAGFIALFLGHVWFGWRRRESDGHVAGATLALATVAMAFAFAMLDHPQVAQRFGQLYGFVMLVQLAVIAVVMARPSWDKAQLVAAALLFCHLAAWTTDFLTAANLTGILAVYLVFGALHAVVPVLVARRWPEQAAGLPQRVAPWAGPLVLLLILLPVFHLSPLPLALWVAVLLVDLLVIALAVVTAAVLPVLGALLLTMGVATMWLLRAPSHVGPLWPFLTIITLFSLLFIAASKGLMRRMAVTGWSLDPAKQALWLLPVCSALLPFGLLVLALGHLPVANPSPVFGVALLMSVLLGGLAILGKQGPLALAALIATLAVEAAWHGRHFNPDAPGTALAWYLGFYALFMGFPFVFRRAFADQAAPWIASALSGVGHFLLIHSLVKQAYPNQVMGLIPAAFALPALGALLMVVRSTSGMAAAQRSQLAWFGGVALLFITLVFPIQFERQWLTVSWALEGAMLLWLFRRVPHAGLHFTGMALLGIAFLRFTFNPAVFTAYPRGGGAILNWQLFAYSAVAAAQFLGGHWFSDPSGWWRVRLIPARGALFAFGAILLFLLLNIEIADYFTMPGSRYVTFRFGGNFARDMTYSIGWGLFSLLLLGMGIWKKSPHARFAAIGLLVVTLLKVFGHDMAAIGNVYRIGALVGVAIIAFIASFLYQRFFDRSDAQ